MCSFDFSYVWFAIINIPGGRSRHVQKASGGWRTRQSWAQHWDTKAYPNFPSTRQEYLCTIYIYSPITLLSYFTSFCVQRKIWGTKVTSFFAVQIQSDPMRPCPNFHQACTFTPWTWRRQRCVMFKVWQSIELLGMNSSVSDLDGSQQVVVGILKGLGKISAAWLYMVLNCSCAHESWMFWYIIIYLCTQCFLEL